MNQELERLQVELGKHKRVEDVFGGDPVEAKKVYRRLSRVAHPDKYRDGKDIALAMVLQSKLNGMWSRAEAKIGAGTYGTSDAVVISTKKWDIAVTEDVWIEGDLCNLYECTYAPAAIAGRVFDPKAATRPHGILKVAKDPSVNDLVRNEAEMLKKLHSNPIEEDKFYPFVSDLVDTMELSGNGGVSIQANLLSRCDGFYSLAEVAKAYPNGIDPRDVV